MLARTYAFGTVKNQADVAGQIARMVIAGDGNGYALSNDANHLMRFTTGKKPEITDLGPVSDAEANDRKCQQGRQISVLSQILNYWHSLAFDLRPGSFF